LTEPAGSALGVMAHVHSAVLDCSDSRWDTHKRKLYIGLLRHKNYCSNKAIL